jgi:hypothetical protein
MQVRAGIDPDHEDDFVRFRTTYYFRAYDACYVGQGPVSGTGNWRTDNVFGGKKDGPFFIQSDSLYRFHMTGKAASLFTKVHFESGTLRKEQIDPFGAAVVHDRQNNRFYFQSQEETRRDAARAKEREELERLLQFRNAPGLSTANQGRVDSAINDLIDRQTPPSSTPPAATLPPAQQAERMSKVANTANTVATQLAQAVTDSTALLQKANAVEAAAQTSLIAGHRNLGLLWNPPQLANHFRAVETALADIPVTNASEDVKRSIDVAKLAAGNAVSVANGLFAGPNNAHASIATLTTGAPADAAIANAETAMSTAQKTADVLVAAANNLQRLTGQAVDKLRPVAAADVRDKAEKAQAAAEAPVKSASDLHAALNNAAVALQRFASSRKATNAANKLKTDLTTATAGAASKSNVWKSDTAAASTAGNTFARDAAAKIAAEFVDKLAAPTASQTSAAAATTAATSGTNFARALGKANTSGDEAVEELRSLSGAATASGSAANGISASAPTSTDQQLQTELQQAAGDLARKLSALLASASDARASGGNLAAAAGKLDPPAPAVASTDSSQCPPGFSARRGFQIRGPQGWVTFDPDERLLMAMSSSAKPLIQTLQEFSGRVLAAQPTTSDILLPLVQERLKISEAQRQMDRVGATPGNPTDALNSVIKAFQTADDPEDKLQ